MIDRLDAVEALAYRDMFAAAPPSLARSLGLETRETAGATLLLAPGIPTPQFNRVVGLGNTRLPSESELDSIADAYRSAGVKTWWAQVSPGAHSEDLVSRLTARGFAPAERRAWAKMSRGREKPAPVPSRAEVRAPERGEEKAFAEALCAAFGMPPALAPWLAALAARPGWRAAAAFLDGKVVGGGFAHLQGAGAWLGVGGVRPEARGQHVHRALMTLRIEQAIESGCGEIVTETGEPAGDEPSPSLQNMRACGFSQAYSRLNYASPT